MKTTSNQLSLVILAGGLGSRYNGQKQIDSMGPNNECLMEYSIYDAISVGIRDFIFVINDKFESSTQAYFKNIIEKKGATVRFVTQTVKTYVPSKYLNDEFCREKPWGTAHALLTVKDNLYNPFLVINADDYYGKNAYNQALKWTLHNQISNHQYGIVAYALQNTLSDNGSVSRGICEINNQKLLQVVERTNIYKQNKKIVYKEGDEITEIEENVPVSMNFWVLHPSIFDYLEQKFEDFLLSSHQNLKAEFYLPQAINELLISSDIEVIASISGDTWFGMTYPEDKDLVKRELVLKINKGKYPHKLWM